MPGRRRLLAAIRDIFATISALPAWAVPALACLVLVVIYHLTYIGYDATPGNNPRFPAGWWGWYDQGKYLESAKAIFRGDFSPAQHHYPPLYPSLAVPLLAFTEYHAHYVVDLVLLLAYALVFLALTSRYIGPWASFATLIAGVAGYKAIRVQWAIPWTTTLSAVLFVTALYLLDRFVRLRRDPAWSTGRSVANAFALGLTIGLVVPTRPVDVLVLSPVAVVYAVMLLVDTFKPGGDRRGGLASASTGVVAFLLPAAAYVAFNYAVFGTPTSRAYFAMAESVGFWPQDIGAKLFSHLLSSWTYYGEARADWLSALPAFAVALAFLPVAVFVGPVAFRVAAVVAMAELAVYYSFSDIIPTGTFRYNNIHYFKWLAPVAFAITAYILLGCVTPDGSRRTGCRYTALGALAIAGVALSLSADYKVVPASIASVAGREIVLNTAAEPIDFIDFSRLGGGWTDVYFADDSHVTLDDRHTLAHVRDYRLLPTQGGVRLLFLHPIAARSIKFIVGKGMSFSGSGGDIGVHAEQVRYRLGPPGIFARSGRG